LNRGLLHGQSCSRVNTCALIHTRTFFLIIARKSRSLWYVAKISLGGESNKCQKTMVSDWQPPRPFVYTPLHGVGGLVLPTLCRSLGINDFVSVAAQEKPDPDFPTVKFPNPEESGALDLAIQTADQEGNTLIIANDPDADRFAVAEKVE
jgi:phosphomannomutase